MPSAEYQQSLDAIARRRAIAEQLATGAMQSEGTQMSGTGRHPIAVAQSPFEALAKLGTAYVAKKQLAKADTDRAAIAKAMGADRAKALEGLIPQDMAPSYQQDPTQDDSQGPTRMTAVPGARGRITPQAQQAAIDAGIDPSVIAAAGKEPQRFTLKPGEIVKDETGATIATGGESPDKAKPANIQEYEYAQQQGYKGSFSDFQLEQRRAGAVSVNVGDKLPAPPQGMGYMKDPTSPFGYKLVKIPGAKDTRSESQQKAGLLSQRMKELSGDVVNEAPSVTSQQLATFAEGGGIGGAMANKLQSEKNQKHFNAARGWLSGILRQDTGATISKEEFQQYYPTYFPVPGDTAPVIEQKRKLRAVTEAGLANIGGEPDAPAAPAGAAPTGDVQKRIPGYYGK